MKENQGRMLLLDKAKSLPEEPGVYLLKEVSGGILYIGKAKSLKNRVTSYFQSGAALTPRIQWMVSKVTHLEVILATTEAEALILECHLIKKHRPPFNVRLKDDKSYPYIGYRRDVPIPRLEWLRRPKKDSLMRVFGPFPSAFAARQILESLTRTFKLRDCSDNTFSHRTRPCLIHQMGRCTAPCVRYVTPEEYGSQMEQAVRVLEGKSGKFSELMEKEMEVASDREDFELAAEIRDLLKNLQTVIEPQAMVLNSRVRNLDVLHIHFGEQAGEVQEHRAFCAIVQVRDGQVQTVKHSEFQLELSPGRREPDRARGLFHLISQSYKPEVPHPLMVSEFPSEHLLLQKALGTRLVLAKGKDALGLMAIAEANAKFMASKAQKISSSAENLEALRDVARQLHLTSAPLKIECYDNSNFQGSDAVGSRVVFIEGQPEKSLYRRYKIRSVEGPDDFATMREVLGRRLSHLDSPGEELPDLIVVDGGRGQLAQAVSVLVEKNLNVPVVGLAKDKTFSEFEKATMKTTGERVFTPGRKNPILLNAGSGAFRVLTSIRNEAHRFALSYHRSMRKKRILQGPKS